MDLTALPNPILSAILDTLDEEDQAACAVVCRDWLRVVRSRCRDLRIVVRPPDNADPERAISTEELRSRLERFSGLTGLRIAGLAAAEEVLPPLPPLPQLHALDLESCGLSSQPLSSWLRLENLTSLSYTERNCDLFTGEELLALPLLQDLSITCLFGDLHGFLSRMPEMPALKGFSLTAFVGFWPEHSAEASFPWMCNLERLQLRLVSPPQQAGDVVSLLPEAIVGSCSKVQHLSISTEVCTGGSILKAAGLEFLRSLQVHAVKLEPAWALNLEAAWEKLKDKLTVLCVTDGYGLEDFFDCNLAGELPQLPTGLEILFLPAKAESDDEDVDAHILEGLVNLRQLRLDSSIVISTEAFTAVPSLTRLQMSVSTDDADTRETLLGALPQLRELVLDLRVYTDMPAHLEAGLLSGISQSSAEVNLGVMVHPCMSFFPSRFMAAIGERISALRVCRESHLWGYKFQKGEGRAFTMLAECELPRLQRAQLRVNCPQTFMKWLESLGEQGICSAPQLRYVCLLFDSRQSEAVTIDQLKAAVCSAFPSVLEVCIHFDIWATPFSLCASCSANNMDRYFWMFGSNLY